MGDKIYNKNAREAHLMAEAYSSINEAYGDAEIAHLVQQALEELSETDASAEAALYNLRDMLR